MQDPITLLRKLEKLTKDSLLPIKLLHEQYSIDSTRCGILEQLEDAGGGVYLHDASGIGLHSYALFLYECCIKKLCLEKYEGVDVQVLLLPIMQAIKGEQPINVEAIGKLWGIKVVDPKKKRTIIIVSGYDSDFLSRRDIDKTCLAAWQRLIKSYDYIVVGDEKGKDVFNSKNNHMISVSEPYFHIDYQLKDGGASRQVAVSAKNLSEIFSQVTEDRMVLTEHGQSVRCVDKSSIDRYVKGEIPHVIEKESRVDQGRVLLTPKQLLKSIAGIEQKPEIDSATLLLDSPEKWFYAAISAVQYHKDYGDSQRYFIYVIGNNLIVRDMVKRKNYMSNIGVVEDHEYPLLATVSSLMLGDDLVHEVINPVIGDLSDDAKMKDIICALKKKTSEYRTKIKGRGTEEFQESHLKLMGILSGINAPMEEDVEKAKKTSDYSDLSYPKIQANLTKLKKIITNDFEGNVSRLMANLLSGIACEHKILPCILACLHISETSRRPSSSHQLPAFMAIKKMLGESVEASNFSWRHLVVHPDLPEKPPQHLDELILMDVLSIYGGLHAMAHNHSYHHCLLEQETPIKGMVWPALKEFSLYAKWLELELKHRKIEIDYVDCKVDFKLLPLYRQVDCTESAALSEMDADLCLTILIQNFVMPSSGDKEVIPQSIQPFLDGDHLIAHPERLDIYHNQLGTFVRVTTTEDDTKYIQLTSQSANFVACKLEGIRRENDAETIYRGLIRRFPDNLIYRIDLFQLRIFSGDCSHELIEDLFQQEDEISAGISQEIDSGLDQEKIRVHIGYLTGVMYFKAATVFQRRKDYFFKFLISECNIFLSDYISPIPRQEYVHHLSLAYYYRGMAQLLLITLFSNLFFSGISNPLPSSRYAIMLGDLEEFIQTYHDYDDKVKSYCHHFFEGVNLWKVLLFYLTLQTLQRAYAPEYVSLQSVTDGCVKINLVGPSHLNMLLVESVRLIIQNFQEEMEKRKPSFDQAIEEMMPKQKTPEEILPLKSILCKKSQQLYWAQRDSKLILPIRWNIPLPQIVGWLMTINLSFDLMWHNDHGPCIVIPKATPAVSIRPLPLPSPENYLLVTRDPVCQPSGAFEKFKKVFSDFSKKLKDFKVEGLMHHGRMFTAKCEMPELHLVRRSSGSEIFDVLITVPRAIPIQMLLDWLAEKKLRYRVVNHPPYGRCLCVLGINCYDSGNVEQLLQGSGYRVSELLGVEFWANHAGMTSPEMKEICSNPNTRVSDEVSVQAAYEAGMIAGSRASKMAR